MVELEEGNALCKREAAWVFLNMCECSGDPGETIIPEIVGHGVIAAVCENLSSDSDAETLLVMLSLLYTILDEGGLGSTLTLSEYTTLVEEAQGFDKIMGLANDHDDMEIYDKAMDIIQAFHDSQEDEDDDDDELVFGVAHAAAASDAASDASDAATRACAVSSNHDDSSDMMSDDSLSDDSFHRELAGAASGPITPPPAAQRRPSEASPIAPPTAEQQEEEQQPGCNFKSEKNSPRQPLGTVQQQHLLATGSSSALSPRVSGGVAARGGKRADAVGGCEVGDME
ncbi:Importin alpha-7 subunit, putative [Ectocarpus siliculosus]|uniref:Importin alpha-7 subunit, putative n=1 Tax=Ectocarpus siliculosus TaxID=2880 RepID=D7G3N3_ECTSI|nr:Importin alpha-7 subunit, putative [Ectocarpus siliculosus]|eukprot:CBJ33565.1 Importin alpha-7 subunit, putative [Ectocarpus siliculosus]